MYLKETKIEISNRRADQDRQILDIKRICADNEEDQKKTKIRMKLLVASFDNQIYHFKHSILGILRALHPHLSIGISVIDLSCWAFRHIKPHIKELIALRP